MCLLQIAALLLLISLFQSLQFKCNCHDITCLIKCCWCSSYHHLFHTTSLRKTPKSNDKSFELQNQKTWRATNMRNAYGRHKVNVALRSNLAELWQQFADISGQCYQHLSSVKHAYTFGSLSGHSYHQQECSNMTDKIVSVKSMAVYCWWWKQN